MTTIAHIEDHNKHSISVLPPLRACTKWQDLVRLCCKQPQTEHGRAIYQIIMDVAQDRDLRDMVRQLDQRGLAAAAEELRKAQAAVLANWKRQEEVA